MSIEFSPEGDFAQVTDGLTTVRFSRPGSSGSTEVSDTLRQTIRTREIEAAGGRFVAGDVAWSLPIDALPNSPQPKDLIIDADGGRWTILHARRMTADTRWRCVTRNLAIVHGLDEYVDVERANYEKSDAGVDVPVWHVWRTGIHARIQPVETHAEHEQDRRVTHRRFTVFLAEDLILDQTHRLRGADGTTYQVLGCRKPDRIDALMEVDIERVT